MMGKGTGKDQGKRAGIGSLWTLERTCPDWHCKTLHKSRLLIALYNVLLRDNIHQTSKQRQHEALSQNEHTVYIIWAVNPCVYLSLWRRAVVPGPQDFSQEQIEVRQDAFSPNMRHCGDFRELLLWNKEHRLVLMETSSLVMAAPVDSAMVMCVQK